MALYHPLTAAALRLKHLAPNEYAELVRELQAISHDLRTALVRADPSAIHIVQGRAQQAEDLLFALDPPKPSKPSTPQGLDR